MLTLIGIRPCGSRETTHIVKDIPQALNTARLSFLREPGEWRAFKIHAQEIYFVPTGITIASHPDDFVFPGRPT